MVKKLTSNAVSAVVAKTYKQKEVSVIANGDTYKFEVDVVFEQDKINNMCQELFILNEFCAKTGITFSIPKMINVLMIKYFSSYDMPYEVDSEDTLLLDRISAYVEHAKKLVNFKLDNGSNAYDAILDSFDKEETKRITQRISDTLKEMDKALEAINEQKKKMEESNAETVKEDEVNG